MPTSHETLRRAIARLRRKPFSTHVDEGLHGDKAYPIPYVADRPEWDMAFVSHADGHNPIFAVGDVLCQVCGEHLRDDDVRIWLMAGEKTGLSHEAYVEIYADPPHTGTRVHVTSSIGPLHPWCARVSLRFCPELRVVDPSHVIGWRCDTPLDEDSYRVAYDFNEFGGHVTGFVDVDQLLDLDQLDRIVEANKKSHP